MSKTEITNIVHVESHSDERVLLPGYRFRKDAELAACRLVELPCVKSARVREAQTDPVAE